MMTSSSSSSSSSSSPSSEGHCLREERGMEKFEHPHLHHLPPLPLHCRGKKHHRHRHHSRPSPPPPPPPHRHYHFFAHSDHSPPLRCPHHHHHKKGQLRMKPPKPSKKVHKLHRKLTKAYMKLSRCPRHGSHQHHTHFPPPKEGVFRTHIGHHHPPGCCLHGMEEDRFSIEEQCRLHHMGSLRRPGAYHKTCPLIKSEIVGNAPVVPPIEDGAEARDVPVVPPIEAGLDSDMPPADEPAPVIMAP